MEGPGPGAYAVNMPIGGSSYSLGTRFDEKRVPMYKKADGSRFDSMLRAKPHLKPKKVDGPGPGDYKLPDSVKTKYRAEVSKQESTFGNGRQRSASPGKRKQEWINPGPGNYNHVFPVHYSH